MKAILLAAGRGTRISRKVERVPKSTLPVDGVPLIRRSVELLQSAGMQCIVCTGYEEQKVKKALEGIENITYCYNPFFDITNSIASIWFAKNEMDDDLLVLNADVFFSSEILEQVIADQRNPVMAIDYSRTLIVCGFVMMAAIQSFFAGLILSNMALKNRRDFEYRLTLVCEKEERKRGQYN